jgi:hypothetical protein
LISFILVEVVVYLKVREEFEELYDGLVEVFADLVFVGAISLVRPRETEPGADGVVDVDDVEGLRPVVCPHLETSLLLDVERTVLFEETVQRSGTGTALKPDYHWGVHGIVFGGEVPKTLFITHIHFERGR